MKVTIPVRGLLIVCTLVIRGYAQEAPPGSADRSPIRIEECVVKLADQRSLASAQSGIIEKVLVREGDRVKEGQLLAKLDARVPLAALAVARTQASSDVNERYARYAFEVASAEYEMVLDSREKNRASFSRIQVEKYRLEKRRSEIEIEVALHERRINEERRDEAAALVSTYRIVAPMDGLISRVFKSAGEAVQVGETLLECQNTSLMHVEANIRVHLLESLRPGSQVRIIPDRQPAARDGKSPDQPIIGTVFFVGARAELSSRSVRVLVEADNRDGRLLAGTTASLEIQPVSRSGLANAAQAE